MKIGVLDSGIGGLTILKRLIKECPNHEYVYFGDTLNMPYGENTRDEVIKFGNNIIKFLESIDIDIIVIACGTLSSNIEYLKSNKKIISLLPLLKNKLDNYKDVSIMATPLSIKTNAFKNYIKTNLYLIPCYNLAYYIENNDYTEIDNLLRKYLKDIKSEALLLGCTHYPIIKKNITKYYNGAIIGLDEFIVKEIKDLKKSKFKLKLYFSSVNNKLINNVENILDINNLNIEERIL